MNPTDSLISAARHHMNLGAELADSQSATAFAAQIRLAAAALPATHADNPPEDARRMGDTSIVGHLEAALECLDAIKPLVGPPDLQLSAWHVHELRRIATGALAS